MVISIHSANTLENILLNKEANKRKKESSSSDSFVQKAKIIKKADHQNLATFSEENDSAHEIDFLFAKLFHRAKEAEKVLTKTQFENSLINLDPSFSEDNLQRTLSPCFIETLLIGTKQEIRHVLEEDPCSGQYWKELHEGLTTNLPLKKLQKLYFCLDSFVHPLPKTPEEMLVIIKEKLNLIKD